MQAARRHLLRLSAAGAACVALPALASPGRVLPPMTDGPFYPGRRWRDGGPFAAGGWDADLTRVAGQPRAAEGEHLGLLLQVADSGGRSVDGVEIEIWQCDARAAYRHPRIAADDGAYDPGFQGFGAGVADRDGTLRLRTIRPVPYPGRTPHIHVKLRHVTFGELSSQLFVDGDPGNDVDFLWRRLDGPAQRALALELAPTRDHGLRWQASHRLIVPA